MRACHRCHDPWNERSDSPFHLQKNVPTWNWHLRGRDAPHSLHPRMGTAPWGQLGGSRTRPDQARIPSPPQSPSLHPAPRTRCLRALAGAVTTRRGAGTVRVFTPSRQRPLPSAHCWQPGVVWPPPRLPRRRRVPSSRRHAPGVCFCERRGAGNVLGRRPPTSAWAGGDTQQASALREHSARFWGAITPTPVASHPGRLPEARAWLLASRSTHRWASGLQQRGGPKPSPPRVAAGARGWILRYPPGLPAP